MVLEASAIVAIIAVSMTGLTGLVQTIWSHMSQSRCIKIKCWGCECIRDVMDAEELEIVNRDNNE